MVDNGEHGAVASHDQAGAVLVENGALPTDDLHSDLNSPSQCLIKRQNRLLERIDILETRFLSLSNSSSKEGSLHTNGQADACSGRTAVGSGPQSAQSSMNEKLNASQLVPNGVHLDGYEASTTQQRLEEVLRAGGASDFKFVRVPSDYYDRTFEERRDLLGAASVEHLCKSIVMVNTQAGEGVVDCSDPKNSKYYVVVSQYAAKLNAERIKQFVHALNEGRIPKKRFNMRLAPEKESDELTGFVHNAVTPIGMKTSIPVILSEAICKLQPGYFWLGGGEVDLKLGIKTSDFIDVVKPFIVDC